MVEDGIKKALGISREEALKRVEEKKKVGRRHKFICEYDPRTSKHVADTLWKNYQAMVDSDVLCKKVFPERILVVNKR